MTIVPLTFSIVNWTNWMRAVKQERNIDVTEHLDRAGIPLSLPSSYISALGNLKEDETCPAFNERLLSHLHIGFYYSLDLEFVHALATLTDLKLSDYNGHGAVSGTFLDWRNAVAVMLQFDNLIKLAIGFFRYFERAGLDRYFSRDIKDDIRKKGQASGW